MEVMHELHTELVVVLVIWVLAYKGWYHIWKGEYVSATACLTAVAAALMFLTLGRFGEMLVVYAAKIGVSANIVHAGFGVLFTLSSGILALFGANMED